MEKRTATATGATISGGCPIKSRCSRRNSQLNAELNNDWRRYSGSLLPFTTVATGLTLLTADFATATGLCHAYSFQLMR
jgi:hypothetical protein